MRNRLGNKGDLFIVDYGGRRYHCIIGEVRKNEDGTTTYELIPDPIGDPDAD